MFRTFRVVVVALCSTTVLASAATAVALVRSTSPWIDRIARAWARSILWAAGVTVSIENEERFRTTDHCVIVANHYSYFDIPVLLASIPHPLRIFAKASLFKIPIFGWSIRAAGFIPIDRKNRRTALQSFDLATERIRKGNSILVFPEEGRTRHRELRPFQRGAFLLALRSELPILPIVIQGTRNVMKVGQRRITPGPVKVTVLEPIDTHGMRVRDNERVAAETRQKIRVVLFGDEAATDEVPDEEN